MPAWAAGALVSLGTLGGTEVRIATRNSPLALWQANHVAEALCQVRPEVSVSLVSTATHADRRLDRPISELGGKGAFSKEIQQLVLDGRADVAVHSAKDLQAVTPDGLTIAAFPERGEVRDALVGARLDQLGPGSRVATGSNRRRALLRSLVAGVELHELRGNIATRLEKAAGFDAVIMAAVALERLGVRPEAVGGVDILDPAVFVPQVGQGALAVEVREDDGAMRELVSGINHFETEITVRAERSFLAELGGDCTLPAGAHARLLDAETGEVSITGVLADESGLWLERRTEVARSDVEPGRSLARMLRKAVEARAV